MGNLVETLLLTGPLGLSSAHGMMPEHTGPFELWVGPWVKLVRRWPLALAGVSLLFGGTLHLFLLLEVLPQNIAEYTHGGHGVKSLCSTC